MRCMIENESRMSDTSRVITRIFISTITSSVPHKFPPGFIAAGLRCMKGDVFCDALDIPRPDLLDCATDRGCCWLTVVLCRPQRAFSACDHLIIMVREFVNFWCGIADAGFQQSRRTLKQLYVDPDVTSNDSSTPCVFRYVPRPLSGQRKA